jgi:hypothetical protein
MTLTQPKNMMILNIVKCSDAMLMTCPSVIKQAVIIMGKTANLRGRKSISIPIVNVKMKPRRFILFWISVIIGLSCKVGKLGHMQ